MNLLLRNAISTDSEKLLQMLCEVNGKEYQSLAQNYIDAMFSNSFRKPNFVVAYHGEELIGAAAYSEEMFTVNVWGISWVSVLKDHRNKGIGGKIVQECLSKIKEKLIAPATVIVSTYPNETGLYDRLGFKYLGNDHEGGKFMTLSLNNIL